VIADARVSIDVQLGSEPTVDTTESDVEAESKDTEMGPLTRKHPSPSDLEEGLRCDVHVRGATMDEYGAIRI